MQAQINMTDSNIDVSKLSIKELRILLEKAELEVENRRDDAIRDMRSEFDQKLHDNGFSIRELYPELFRTTAAPKTENKQSVTPKYRNPDNPDETWTGRGRVIQWVTRTAEEKGISVDDIRNDPKYLNPDHPNDEAHKAEIANWFILPDRNKAP